MRRNNKALYEQIMRNISKQIKNVLNEELYVIGYVNGSDDGMAEVSIIRTFDDKDSAESALEDYEEEYGQTAIDYVNGSGPDLWNEGSEVAGELVFYTKSQYWRGLDDDDDDEDYDDPSEWTFEQRNENIEQLIEDLVENHEDYIEKSPDDEDLYIYKLQTPYKHTSHRYNYSGKLTSETIVITAVTFYECQDDFRTMITDDGEVLDWYDGLGADETPLNYIVKQIQDEIKNL